MPPIPFIHLTEPQAWAIGCACVFMLLDVVTGFVAAAINNDIMSSKMRTGLGHKVALVCLIILALMVETASEHIAGLGFGGVMTVTVCVYIIVMEVASVCENICKADPDLIDTPVMKLFNHEDKDGAN